MRISKRFKHLDYKPDECRKCGITTKQHIKLYDKDMSSVYGLCDKCHDEFIPYLRQCLWEFIHLKKK